MSPASPASPVSPDSPVSSVSPGRLGDTGAAALVESSAAELTAHGFPAMPARVVMALTVNEDCRLTSEELTTQLSASPAAISGAVRYLNTLGVIRQATVAGSRRHVYSLTHTPWYTVSLTNPSVYRNLTRLLESGSTQLDAGSAARARVEEMAEFFRFLEQRMPELLDEWNARRGV